MTRKPKTPPKPKLHDCPGCIERGRSPRSRIAFPGVCIECSTPPPVAERPEQPEPPPGVRWCFQCEFDGAWTAAEFGEDYCAAHRPPEPVPPPKPGRCAACHAEGRIRSVAPGTTLCSEHQPAAADAQADWDDEEVAAFYARNRTLKSRLRDSQNVESDRKIKARAARRERAEADTALMLALDAEGGAVGRATHMEHLRRLSRAADLAAERERETRQLWEQAVLARRKAAEALRSSVRGWFERLPLLEARSK